MHDDKAKARKPRKADLDVGLSGLPEDNPLDFERCAIVVGTGKPAVHPPGTPWWRRLLDDYWG